MRPSASMTLEKKQPEVWSPTSVCSLCLLVVWLFGCSDDWVMRWLVAWLVGWLADWMVGWFVRDHSCDGRRLKLGAAGFSFSWGASRNASRNRSWVFLGRRADQTVDLDMLQLRNVRKVFLTATFWDTRCFLAAPMDWANLPCREERKERQGQGQQRRPQEW